MLTKYIHTKFTHKPNKYQMKPIEMKFSDMEEFNEVYNYCKNNFLKVEPTASGSMPYNNKCKLRSRYMVLQSKTKIELTVVCHLGCYRFIIGNKRNEIDNPVSGKQAVKEIYKKAKELNISLEAYKTTPEEGKKIKEEILPPHIQMYGREGRVYTNVHHLDLNSSFASRISEVYPELKPLYEYMYSHRKENDGYYKHILTNHIGCFQSQYCIDYNNAGKYAPYQFAMLAKIAVNNTTALIEEYVEKLTKTGRKVLLTNTDGIWYQGEIFTDENEGSNFGQWKNDHKNCKFLMKSKGAYQFVEDNICKSVVRGISSLDKEKAREDWAFGEILRNDIIKEQYAFTEEEGVIKYGAQL